MAAGGGAGTAGLRRGGDYRVGFGAQVRKRIWVSLGVAVVLVVGAGFGVKPWARHLVRTEAARRGVVLDAMELSLAWGSLHLRNVRLHLEGVSGLDVQLNRLDVQVGLSGQRLRGFEVDGGQVRLRGKWEELEARLREFRERHAAAPSAEPKGGEERTESVRGVDVVWDGAFPEGGTQRLSGLGYARTAEGRKFEVELVSLEKGSISLAVGGVALSFGLGERAQSLRLARAEQMKLRYRMQAVVAAAPGAGGTDTPLPPDDDEPTADGGALLERFRLDPGRVVTARAVLGALRKLAPRLPEKAEVAALELLVERPPDAIEVGPQRLTVTRTADEVGFTLSPGALSRGTPLSLSGRLPLDPSLGPELKLEGGPLSLRALGVKEGDFGLHRLEESALSGSVKLELSPDAETVRVDGQAAVQSLELQSAALSPTPVLLDRLAVGGRAEWAVDGSHYSLRGGELRLGEARFATEFEVGRGADFVTLDWRAKAPLVSCQALLDSAPRGLLGDVAALGFQGTFSLDASMRADTRQMGKMLVHWAFENRCKIQKVPPSLDPEQFRGVFQREVLGLGEVPEMRDFGPGSREWTPFSEVSRHLESALLVTEDGRFFRHHGFDDRAIESSIRDNTRAGKFVRGASTISMQLAKNLYLSRDKNLSRKLQEAALTLLLEQSFDKAGLLELYVNVVEFGPGVYGIRQAAEHYFSSTPAALTAAQCFFLASILPAPTRDYFGADGHLRASRKTHVDRLLGIARKRDRLTDAELEAALAEQLVFGQPSTLPPAATEGAPLPAEPPVRGP